jgi:hypothetical protein
MMRRTATLILAALSLVVFTRATCGKPKVSEVTPVLKMTIKDHVRFHNMGITFDGSHYFTLNGGNEEYCDLHEYDKSGSRVASYDVSIDGRSIFYHPDNEELYAKVYGTGLSSIDLDDESASEELEDAFTEDNSSVGFSPDGSMIYELLDGDVTAYEFDSGDEQTTFTLGTVSDETEGGYSMSIAASDKFLFVWKNEDEIAVYTLKGKYVTSFELPKSGLGFSLSWCNNMLWVAKDADGSTDGADGYWYGFRLDGLR